MSGQPDDGARSFESEAFESLAVEAQLQAELDRAQELIRDLRQELAAIAESTAAVPDDEHDAEGSTVAYERARVQALLNHTRQAAAALEAASRRLADAGGPGAADCEQCGRPIGTERLVALPATRVCVSCAAARR